MGLNKLFKIIGSIIGILILVVIITIVIICIKIYDPINETPQYVIDENPQTEVVINEVLYKSLSKVDENKKVNLLLDEKDLTRLAYSLLKKLDFQGIKILSAYVDIDNKEILLTVPFTYLGVNSRLTCSIFITEEDGTFSITINKLNIGSLDLSSKLVRMIVKRIFQEESTKTSLNEKGFYFNIDIEKIKVVVTKDDIIKMLINFVEEPDQSLYVSLLDILLGNDELVHFSFGENDLVGLSINLNELQYDVSRDGVLPYNFDYEAIIQKINLLLDKQILDLTYESLLFSYLIKGYDLVIKDGNLKEKDINYLKTINLTSIGITNNEEYKGIITSNNKPMSDYFTTMEIDPTTLIIDPRIEIQLNENVFNQIFKNLGVVGIGMAMSQKDEANYHTAYFVVDQFYVQIIDNQITFNIVINISGCRITLKAVLYGEESSLASINTTLTKISIGNHEIASSSQTYILNYLSKVLSHETWIKVEVATSTITLDFSSYIETIPGLRLVKYRLDEYKTTFKEDVPQGYLSITLHFRKD